MGQLKIRFRFNPGGSGAPMDRFGEFAAQMERFLRSFARDFRLESQKGFWLAKNFTNDSVAFDATYAGAPDDATAFQSRHALNTLFGENPVAAINENVSYGTLAEFSKVGLALEPDEFYYARVYDDNDELPPEDDDHMVTFQRTAEIRQLLSAPFITHGAIQGVFHAWHPGADEPFFSFRASQNGDLVHVQYPPEMYGAVHDVTADVKAVIIVTGEIHWDRATNGIIRVVADAPPVFGKPLTESEFERLFGSAPQYTGTMTTAEYIDWVRGDAD